MDEPIYPLNKSNDSVIFHFESIGPNGVFLKEVKFDPVEDIPHYYQLALYDIDEDNNRSVLSESRNQDMNKVMATVIKCILIFLENNPNANVVFTGSTAVRTRLYKIIINKLFDKVSNKFKIQGFSEAHGFEIFNMNHEYSFFVVSFKHLN
jgi:hypothetical protein